jgi:hypothetical protein
MFLLLSDPAIAAKLRAYVRSNKWAMDPEKLSKFSQDRLVPKAAEQYLQHITHNEMPRGLKRYMEYELFPWIHLRVGHGISLATARRWLHNKGFKYIHHKKGLYFDRHDRADVVEYRQEHFLPAMKGYKARLVCYVVGDVDQELIIPHENYVERRLVLLTQDEMMAQVSHPKCGSWKISIIFKKKELAVAFTRVIHCVRQLDGWTKVHRPWNMVKIMKLDW